MTRKNVNVIVFVVLFSLVLSGCKLPASKAPEVLDEGAMTTPIVIVTDAPEMTDGTTEPKAPEDETGEPGDVPAPAETDVPEPTEIVPTVIVPTVTRPAEYTLRQGEFPFCIARRFDLDPGELLSLNNLGPDDLLEPGTTLQIPQTGTWIGDGRVRNPHPTTHTVAAGETIYSIACFYGDVSPEAIVAVNNLEEPYDLTAGQTLDIP